MILLFYGYVLAGVGFFFLLFCISNILWMKYHSKTDLRYEGPKISVLVPARNEESNIRKCLDSLLNQSYRNYEILVLNDNSEDNTLAILQEYEKNHRGKVRCFDGAPLPEDWQGKCFAMHQLVSHAQSEFLLFTDADTTHTPDSIAYAVTNLVDNQADMISGYIHQDMYTLGEKLTVPLMFMLVNFILLLPLSKFVKNPMFAVAIGQYIAVRTGPFKAVGGFESVKKMTTEDMYLARKLRIAGYKPRFILAEHVARCRMYDTYRKAIAGIGKNIFDFFERRSWVLFMILLPIIVFLTVPPFFALYKVIGILFFHQAFDTLTQCLLVHVAAVFLTWLTVFVFQKLPRRIAFLYPLLFVNLVYTALYSWYKSAFGGGYEWKGRKIT